MPMVNLAIIQLILRKLFFIICLVAVYFFLRFLEQINIGRSIKLTIYFNFFWFFIFGYQFVKIFSNFFIGLDTNLKGWVYLQEKLLYKLFNLASRSVYAFQSLYSIKLSK